MRRVLGLGVAGIAVALGLRRARRRRAPKSVDEQVRDGLDDAAGGWWVALVLDAFEYLISDYGYSLAEVQMHFRGNYIKYRGPVYEFVTEFDPDATHSISAELWVRADLERNELAVEARHPRAFDVN